MYLLYLFVHCVLVVSVSFLHCDAIRSNPFLIQTPLTNNIHTHQSRASTASTAEDKRDSLQTRALRDPLGIPP